jgi:hypothetical protein
VGKKQSKISRYFKGLNPKILKRGKIILTVQSFSKKYKNNFFYSDNLSNLESPALKKATEGKKKKKKKEHTRLFYAFYLVHVSAT